MLFTNFKYWLAVSLSAIASLPAHADKADQQTGIGVGRALAIVEKCTGIGPTTDYVRSIFSHMVDQGVNGEDFKTGFTAGAVQASIIYPGKPPVSECKQAALLKNKLDKQL